MKKCLILTAIIALMLTACTPAQSGENANTRLQVVATLFPQYDIARYVAGEYADVTMLLPAGMESHTFEPRPSDMVKIYNSDIFIYTGDFMEPWAHKMLDGAKSDTLLAVDVSTGVELESEATAGAHDESSHDSAETIHESAGPSHESEAHEDESHEHGFDPHFWLDPTKACVIVDNIAAGLTQKDPAHEQFYKANAEKYKSELMQFDADVRSELAKAKRHTLVFGGRFAYQYFLHHYNIDYITAYDSCSSEAEPSVSKVAQVTQYIRNNGTPCIYYEELSDPKIARAIAKETGIESLQFSTGHNVTREEFESGITYLDICRNNLENIKKGLD